MHTYVLNVMQYSGQGFECNFKRFKEKEEERKLFLEHHQIFSSFQLILLLIHVLHYAKYWFFKKEL